MDEQTQPGLAAPSRGYLRLEAAEVKWEVDSLELILGSSVCSFVRHRRGILPSGAGAGSHRTMFAKTQFWALYLGPHPMTILKVGASKRNIFRRKKTLFITLKNIWWFEGYPVLHSKPRMFLLPF